MKTRTGSESRQAQLSQVTLADAPGYLVFQRLGTPWLPPTTGPPFISPMHNANKKHADWTNVETSEGETDSTWRNRQTVRYLARLVLNFLQFTRSGAFSTGRASGMGHGNGMPHCHGCASSLYCRGMTTGICGDPSRATLRRISSFLKSSEETVWECCSDRFSGLTPLLINI
jgi:hypothetical protein